MKLLLFLKSFVILFAVSLVSFFFLPSPSFMLLLKLVALSLGVSILFSNVYPHIRGIRKGDKVMIAGSGLGGEFLSILLGASALENARIHKEIKLRLPNRRIAIGIVESYEGIISPPRVRLLYEAKEIHEVMHE